jgi:hypothetical protein
MTEREIAQRLYKAAEKHAKDHNSRIGPGADNDIREMAKNGARRIRETAKSTHRSTDELTAAAERDIQRLVREMLAARASLAGYATDVIGEDTLRIAPMRFCPCFPFC